MRLAEGGMPASSQITQGWVKKQKGFEGSHMAATRKLQLHGHDSIALFLPLLFPLLALLLCVLSNVVDRDRLLCLHITQLKKTLLRHNHFCWAKAEMLSRQIQTYSWSKTCRVFCKEQGSSFQECLALLCVLLPSRAHLKVVQLLKDIHV